jgi:hypothetical protein
VLLAASGCEKVLDVDALGNKKCPDGQKGCPGLDGQTHCVSVESPSNGCRTKECLCYVRHANPVCNAEGECDYVGDVDGGDAKGCDPGYRDCNGNRSDGCETDVRADPLNCGGCGVACTAPADAAPGCSGEQCAIDECPTGWGDCDGGVEGCEAETSNDPKNCGFCGYACPDAGACADGGCVASDEP